jgi:hypothetical protein
MKDFSLHSVKFISNDLLPPEANTFRNCFMLFHKLWTVDQQEYYTCRSWTKADMNSFLRKGKQLTVDGYGYASQNAGNFSTSWGLVSSSGRTLLHGVTLFVSWCVLITRDLSTESRSWVAWTLIPTCEVSSSHLSPNTGHHDWHISWFCLVSVDNFRDLPQAIS